MISDKIKRKIYDAVSDGKIDEVRELFRAYPEAMHDDYSGGYLCIAVSYGQSKLVEMMLKEFHFDIEGVNPEENRLSPLNVAVRESNFELAKWLLEHGANPNAHRIVISAIGTASPDMMKLLVEHGINIHTIFEDEIAGGEFNALGHAIVWQQKEIAEYLRSLGATLPIVKEEPESAKPQHRKIIKHFGKHFGKPLLLSQREVVPGPVSVSIHIIPPKKGDSGPILFTTGMSDLPQMVPEGAEDYRYTELFFRLPPTWPTNLAELEQDQFSWPLSWLRYAAYYPHGVGTWLGAPSSVIVNEDPPVPLGKGTKFTSLLLLQMPGPAGQISISEDLTIQVYHVLPIYTEEMVLDREQGTEALIRRFQSHGTPLYLQEGRVNVAKK